MKRYRLTIGMPTGNGEELSAHVGFIECRLTPLFKYIKTIEGFNGVQCSDGLLLKGVEKSVKWLKENKEEALKLNPEIDYCALSYTIVVLNNLLIVLKQHPLATLHVT